MDDQELFRSKANEETREPWEDEPDPVRRGAIAGVLDAVDEALSALSTRPEIAPPTDGDAAIQAFVAEIVTIVADVDPERGLMLTDDEQIWRMLEIAKRGQWEQAMVLHTLAGIRWREGLHTGQDFAEDPGSTEEELEAVDALLEADPEQLARMRAFIAALPALASALDEPLTPPEAASKPTSVRPARSVPTVVSQEALERQVGFLGSEFEIRQ